LLVGTVATAPARATPLEAVALAIEAAGTLLQGRREFSLRRQQVIAANANLQERELSKLASLASALAGALRERGVDELAATLAAEIGIAVFRTAFERWHEENAKRDLTRLIRESFDELKTLMAV
jgi:stage V sporulation protein SpoVS